ncbi:MAG: nicotinamide-nucleotide amidohydrolase family protein [Alphaproteobacteria bacterium]|nr:nicotinamide-nucleotide amidohydrolase family protein [Alphaproteobacteria bacterium]
MFKQDLLQDAERLLGELRAAGLMIAAAESCTGGLISAVLTSIAGSSEVVERGFVTYSNEAKSELLGVPADLIAMHGAVSEQVARAMAVGALAASRAQITVAVTGIAGPGGGSEEKPVGLVYLGAVLRGSEPIGRECRFGDAGRDEVRIRSVAVAFDLVRAAMKT